MSLKEMKRDNIVKQKKGVHFIMTSVIIWSVILVLHLTDLTIYQKNLFTFFAASILMPVAYGISKLLKIDFNNKGNPIAKLGVLFSMNQFLYILIAMWAYNAMPEKMLMVYAIIFGGHLLPFGWLYDSMAYYVMSVLITILSFALGLILPTVYLPAVIIVLEIIFIVWLFAEMRGYDTKES